MILKTQVKRAAEDYLNRALEGKQQYILNRIKREPEFSKWVELCHVRCNQLDLEGYVKSKYAMNDFIQKAACAYAMRVCDKLDIELSEAK